MKTRLLPWLLTTILLTTSVAAPAAPVTRWFEFSSTNGPPQLGPRLGHFSHDDTLAPPLGGTVNGDGLLLALEAQFAGQTRTELNTDSVQLNFEPDKRLLKVLFGTDCHAASCRFPVERSQVAS